jgi:hypothetical protein
VRTCDAMSCIALQGDEVFVCRKAVVYRGPIICLAPIICLDPVVYRNRILYRNVVVSILHS